MSESAKWVDRRFDFDFPVNRYPEFLERLAATPDQLGSLTASVPAEWRIRQAGGAWSIQEHTGHLMMTDMTFSGRLDDFLAGRTVLRAADPGGSATTAENFNARALEEILDRFRARREEYLRRLADLSPDQFGLTAGHPRLNTPMRLCDMLWFQAEHDAWHLDKIRGLVTHWQSRG